MFDRQLAEVTKADVVMSIGYVKTLQFPDPFSQPHYIDEKCTFNKTEPEAVKHLFCNSPSSSVFWRALEEVISCQTGLTIIIVAKDIITIKNKNQEVYHIKSCTSDGQISYTQGKTL